MAKRTLAEAWIFDGVTYGPGEAILPDDVDEALGKRKAFNKDEADPVAEALASQGPQEGGGGEPSANGETDKASAATAPVPSESAPAPKSSSGGSTGKATAGAGSSE